MLTSPTEPIATKESNRPKEPKLRKVWLKAGKEVVIDFNPCTKGNGGSRRDT